MKANVKRPARFSFKTITEKKAKRLTLIFVAVLFLVIVVLALFPLLDREEERYEVTTYARQRILRESTVTERSLVTACRLVNVSRSDNNPQGFLMEQFMVRQNQDLQTYKR